MFFSYYEVLLSIKIYVYSSYMMYKNLSAPCLADAAIFSKP